jgi:hypothetical protein
VVRANYYKYLALAPTFLLSSFLSFLPYLPSLLTTNPYLKFHKLLHYFLPNHFCVNPPQITFYTTFYITFYFHLYLYQGTTTGPLLQKEKCILPTLLQATPTIGKTRVHTSLLDLSSLSGLAFCGVLVRSRVRNQRTVTLLACALFEAAKT